MYGKTMPTQPFLYLLCPLVMYQPVCILVMAHSHEMLLMKLLSKLEHKQVLVFVHIDKKSEALFQKLTTIPGVQLIRDRVNVNWAHISQVLAMFSSYREIKAAGYSFDHFLVISGQDYPAQPIDQLLAFLSSHKKSSFISHIPLSKDGWSGAMKRYRYHYYVRMEKLWRGLMMLTGLRRQFPFGLKPYGGAQWINLATLHMDYVINFCDRHISLMKFMETVRFPEEMLFQTLLMNSEFSGDCINDDLRFVKWIHGKSNPEILDEHHFEEIRNAGSKFFARKFDAERSARLITLLNEQQR
jgi:hypothetical protein